MRRAHPRRRRTAETRAGSPDPEPTPAPTATTRRPRRTARRVARLADNDVRIVHLAMSPRAANYLRTFIAKARYEDEPELDAIYKELESQLKEMGL